MRAYERLLEYVRIHTTSDEESGTAPSSQRQFDLARMLSAELKALGAERVEVSDTCYVYASVPATAGRESLPCLGFIAHIDTAPDFAGENVRPQVIESYDGGEVALGGSGLKLTQAMFPHLPQLRGRTLITTDGATLLGADDKAGIAEIMTLLETLRESGAPHGPLAVCFTPDEEIGCGTEHFDLARFGADFAYTVDGGPEGEIVCENFNASQAVFDVKGVNVHPGDAKNIMVNAALVAMEINTMLPAGDTPRDTEGREGFYHLTDMQGNVESARSRYIVRDHDAGAFAARESALRHIEKLINAKYGEGTVKLYIDEQYRNMIEKILPAHADLIENAKAATRAAGLEPDESPIRGGTDGAMLSWKGLPCPNLGTGGYAYHGPYEHITAEGMDKCVEILKGIVEIYAKA